jgi:ABC-2 type transport system permease protein
MLAQNLSGQALGGLMDGQMAQDETAARQAVDARRADVTVIIPADFSRAAVEPGKKATVTLYQHPDSSIAAKVVNVMVSDFVDGLAGAKIAVHVTSHQLEAQGLGLSSGAAEGVARAYATWLQAGLPAGEGAQTTSAGAQTASAGEYAYLVSRAPATQEKAASQATLFLGPVMAGLMVFFMFFTGAAAAQSILYEDQEGTLARLFATPTSRTAILAGKYLAVLVMLAVQAVVLMTLAALIFGVRWGNPLSVALLTATVVLTAAGFGILLMSFLRTPRQAGLAIGLVVTVTGMLGGLMPTGDPSRPPAFEKFTLALPQGWAMRGWRLTLAGGGPVDILLPLLVLAIVGAALFAAGALMFRRRFA